MTSVESTSKSINKSFIASLSTTPWVKFLKRNYVLIAFILISVIFLSLRLYILPEKFIFAYDNQVEAEAAWNIYYGKKLTLIGQETSIGGLFVGPFLFYFQTVALIIGGFNPMSLAYLAVFTSFLTLITLFFVISDLFNKQQAILGIFLYSISTRFINIDISSNALSYIMITSLLIYWFSYKIFIKRQGDKLPLLTLFIGASFNIHFALLLLIPLVVFYFVIYRPKIKLKYYFYSSLIILFFLLPLIIFNIRHDFLITKNLLTFTSVQSNLLITKILETFNTFLAISSESMFFHSQFYWLISTLFFLGFILIMKRNKKVELLKFTILFTLGPLLLLFIYKGHIPDYYFLPILPILIIISSTVYLFLLNHFKLIFLLLLILISIFNIKEESLIKGSYESFSQKDQIVRWVINDAGQDNFNVYYDLPLAINNGYKYLFKWRHREPIDYSKKLYIITLDTKVKAGNYSQSFPDKVKEVNNFGSISIVSIK